MSIEQPSAPNPESESSNQGLLKKQLLQEEISGKEFLQSILEIDQQDPSHRAAKKNLSVLFGGEIQNFFAGHKLEHKYKNILSLTHFHVGQTAAIEQNNYEKALAHFRNALDASPEDADTQWTDYIRGTIAYFEQTPEVLEEMRDSLEPGRNKEVLDSLLTNLKEGDELDYESAYSEKSDSTY